MPPMTAQSAPAGSSTPSGEKWLLRNQWFGLRDGIIWTHSLKIRLEFLRQGCTVRLISKEDFPR